MASERQVACWIAECLNQHLRPDVLWIERVENAVKIVTRKPGTRDERGDEFVAVARRED